MRQSQINWLEQAEKHFQAAQNGDEMKYESGKYGFNNICSIISPPVGRLFEFNKDIFDPSTHDYYDGCKILFDKYLPMYQKDITNPNFIRVKYKYDLGLQILDHFDLSTEFGDTVYKMILQYYGIRCNEVNRTDGDLKEVEFGDRVIARIKELIGER